MAELNPASAERLARSIPDFDSDDTAILAKRTAKVDPAAAERQARTITEPHEQATSLVELAAVMARRNPAAAERVARTITEPAYRSWALAEIVLATGTRNTAKVEGLLTDPQLLTRSITDTNDWHKAVMAISEAIVEHNPAAAVLLARATGHDFNLARIAGQMAEQNLADADRAARTIANPRWQVQALTEIAKFLTRHP